MLQAPIISADLKEPNSEMAYSVFILNYRENTAEFLSDVDTSLTRKFLIALVSGIFSELSCRTYSYAGFSTFI